jgi:signal transduction histidine kinase
LETKSEMKSHGRILLVDDDPVILKILRRILEEYEVASAATGEEALQVAPRLNPDLILLDLGLPGLNGYEVCRKMRQDPALRHAKIIILSGQTMISERLEGYKAGADDYLSKPFDSAEFLAKVKVYLRLKTVEEVDQLKSNLLKLLHLETNNPLGSIIVPVETLLANEDMDKDERRMWHEMIHRSAISIQRLFEKVMTLNSIKAGNLAFHMEQADFCSSIRDAVTVVSPQAHERKVVIDRDLPESAMTVFDRKQMTRVVSSLLDNAIRFTPVNEHVVVQVLVESECFRLKVTDHGVGIDKQFIAHTFDEFAISDMNYYNDGVGLSLAIARLIMLAHNGRIEVESKKESGTTFSVYLPVVPTS